MDSRQTEVMRLRMYISQLEVPDRLHCTFFLGMLRQRKAEWHLGSLLSHVESLHQQAQGRRGGLDAAFDFLPEHAVLELHGVKLPGHK
eukprot:1871584-Amphidinium_carterae.2